MPDTLKKQLAYELTRLCALEARRDQGEQQFMPEIEGLKEAIQILQKIVGEGENQQTKDSQPGSGSSNPT